MDRSQTSCLMSHLVCEDLQLLLWDRAVSRNHLGVFAHTCFSLLNWNLLTQFLKKISLVPKLSFGSLPNHLPDSCNTIISLYSYWRLNFEKCYNCMISISCHKWALQLIDVILLYSQPWWYFWHMDSAFKALLFWDKEFESEACSGHSLGFSDAETYLLTS